MSLLRARAFARALISFVLIAAAMLIAVPSWAQFGPGPLQGPSTTTLTSSSGGASRPGASLTFTAEVTSFDIALTPFGHVSFTADGQSIGSAPLVNGVATLTGITLAAGTHNIEASFGGDMQHQASSATMPEIVSLATATVQLGSSSNPAPSDGGVTFTATVLGNDGPRTGTVTFSDGATPLATVTLDGAGKATYSTSTLAEGVHGIEAYYNGDQNYGTAIATLIQTIDQPALAPVTVTITSSKNPSKYAEAFYYTITVSGGATTPTGIVRFERGVYATLNNGTAIFQSGGGARTGANTVTAYYDGDATHAHGMGTFVQTGLPPVTAVTLTSDKNPAAFGDTITFSATVTLSDGVYDPSGSVEFFAGTKSLGHGSFPRNSSTATFSTREVTNQTTIKAVYYGDQFHTQGSATLLQLVSRNGAAVATISTSADRTPPVVGQPVTFTIDVAGNGAVPTGMVDVWLNATKQTAQLVNGKASFTFTPAQAGSSVNFNVMYKGDSNYSPSNLYDRIPIVSTSAVPISTIKLTLKSAVEGNANVSLLQSAVQYSYNAGAGLQTFNGDQTVEVARGPVDLASYLKSGDIPLEGVSLSCSAGTASFEGGVNYLRGRWTPPAEQNTVYTCTFLWKLNAAAVEKVTKEGIQNRADQVVAALVNTAVNGVSARAFGRLTGTSTASTSIGEVMAMFPMAASGGPVTVSGSLSALNRQVFRGEDQKRFDVWFEARWQGTRFAADKGSLVVGTVGADYLITPKLLVGAFASMDYSRFTISNGMGSTQGTGWIAGGYAAAKLSENLFVDGMLAGGTSSNTISPFGTYTDSFTTVRLVASTSISGSWKYGAWTFVPTARLTYATEKSAAYTDRLGNTVPSITAGLFQGSAGPGFTYTHVTEGGVVVEPGLSFDVLARIQTSTVSAATTTFYGRIEPSLSVRTQGGISFNLTGNVELGRRYVSYGATAKLLYTFD